MEPRDDVAVDLGAAYVFPARDTFVPIDAGVYYPGRDQNGNFMLIRECENQSAKIPSRMLNMPPSLRERRGGRLRGDNGPSLVEQTLAMLDPEAPDENGKKGELISAEKPYGDDYFQMEDWHDGLKEAHEGLGRFLKHQEFYNKNGISYRRSMLLYGDPGTGKTKYILNLCRSMIEEENAIVVRVDQADHLGALSSGLIRFSNACKDRLKVVVIEELSNLCEYRESIPVLLSLLDSAVMKDNVIFLLTTNYPEQIPENIVDRPSRIDDLIEVDPEGYKDGFVSAYYSHLMKDTLKAPASVMKKLKEYSAAYLKEIFLCASMREISVEESLLLVERRRDRIKNQFKISRKMGFS